jgi:hypothetical protein
MLYKNTLANEFPLYLGDIQLEHPSFQVGDELPEGWVEVVALPFPQLGGNEQLVGTYAELDNGIYYQRYEVSTFTADEINYRSRLDSKIAELEFAGESPIAAIVKAKEIVK